MCSIGPNRPDPCWLRLRCLGLLVFVYLLPSSLNPLLGHVLTSVVASAPGLKVLALGRLIIPTPGLFSPSYLFCDPSQSAWGLLEHLQILDQPWRTTRAILVFLSSPLPVPPLDSTRLRPLSWALHSGGHPTGCTSSHQKEPMEKMCPFSRLHFWYPGS